MMLKIYNQIIIQNLMKAMTIFLNNNISSTTSNTTPSFSTDFATSAFTFYNQNYINYPAKTISFTKNNTQYTINDTLSFTQPYNLTTLILTQNSFAY